MKPLMYIRSRLQHLRRRLVALPIVVGCLLVSGASAQQAMLHDGNPALIFRADADLSLVVGLVDHDGERALRFPVQHQHFSSKACNGYLYVSGKHIAYDPVYTPEFNKDAFSLERGDMKKGGVAIEALTHDYIVAVWSTKKRYLFYALFDSGSGKKRQFGKESAVSLYDFIARSFNDFDGALHETEALTASLGQHSQQAQQEQPPQAQPPSEPVSNAPSAELKEGQTLDEVEQALGKPEDITQVKESLIYTYPTVKVFFENGKLVDVQERKK